MYVGTCVGASVGVAVLSLHGVGAMVGSLVGVIVGTDVGLADVGLEVAGTNVGWEEAAGLGAGVSAVLAQSLSQATSFVLPGASFLIGSRK